MYEVIRGFQRDSMENLPNFFFLINLLCFEFGCEWLAVSSPVSTNSFCPDVSCWLGASSFTGMPTSMIKAGALKVAMTGRDPEQQDNLNCFILLCPPVSAAAFCEFILFLMRGRRMQRIIKMAERDLSFILQGSAFASTSEKNYGS